MFLHRVHPPCSSSLFILPSSSSPFILPSPCPLFFHPVHSLSNSLSLFSLQFSLFILPVHLPSSTSLFVADPSTMDRLWAACSAMKGRRADFWFSPLPRTDAPMILVEKTAKVPPPCPSSLFILLLHPALFIIPPVHPALFILHVHPPSSSCPLHPPSSSCPLHPPCSSSLFIHPVHPPCSSSLFIFFDTTLLSVLLFILLSVLLFILPFTLLFILLFVLLFILLFTFVHTYTHSYLQTHTHMFTSFAPFHFLPDPSSHSSVISSDPPLPSVIALARASYSPQIPDPLRCLDPGLPAPLRAFLIPAMNQYHLPKTYSQEKTDDALP
jgi:hypothetical protein